MSYEQDTHCPKCFQNRKGFEQIQIKYIRYLKCRKASCGYTFNDDETTNAYGLQRCSDGAYESNGYLYTLYPCPYCMVFYYTFEAEQIHQHEKHKVGDPMRCMEK